MAAAKIEETYTETVRQAQTFNVSPKVLTTLQNRKLTKNDVTYAVLIDIGITLIFSITIFYACRYLLPTTQRGYSCKDTSIRLPTKRSTIPPLPFFFAGIGFNFVVIICTEVINSKCTPSKYNLRRFILPQSIVDIYKYSKLFIWGCILEQAIGCLMKRTIGRLRPDFMHVCKPLPTSGIDCSLPEHMFAYISAYTCTSRKSSKMALLDRRHSFPSGHAIDGAYYALFAILYLQFRWNPNELRLMKAAIQLILFSIGWFVGLSRISDNRHYGTDVLAGFLIGSFVSLAVMCYVEKYRRKIITYPRLAGIEAENDRADYH